jgi:hypothetical protein
MEFTSWHRHGQRNWDLSEFPSYTGIISSKVNNETFLSLKMLLFQIRSTKPFHGCKRRRKLCNLFLQNSMLRELSLIYCTGIWEV